MTTPSEHRRSQTTASCHGFIDRIAALCVRREMCRTEDCTELDRYGCAAQRRTVQRSAVQCSAAQRSAAQRSAAQRRTAQRRVEQRQAPCISVHGHPEERKERHERGRE